MAHIDAMSSASRVAFLVSPQSWKLYMVASVTFGSLVAPHDGTGFHDGYKLFYREDVGLMRPASVLALTPPPDLVVYE